MKRSNNNTFPLQNFIAQDSVFFNEKQQLSCRHIDIKNVYDYQYIDI